MVAWQQDKRLPDTSAQQAQHLLRQLVGLRHHGGACLLQDLGAAQAGRFSNGKKYTS